MEHYHAWMGSKHVCKCKSLSCYNPNVIDYLWFFQDPGNINRLFQTHLAGRLFLSLYEIYFMGHFWHFLMHNKLLKYGFIETIVPLFSVNTFLWISGAYLSFLRPILILRDHNWNSLTNMREKLIRLAFVPKRSWSARICFCMNLLEIEKESA